MERPQSLTAKLQELGIDATGSARSLEQVRARLEADEDITARELAPPPPWCVSVAACLGCGAEFFDDYMDIDLCNVCASEEDR